MRSGWWEDQIQVEALAALAAWTHRYDSGEWDDPPGKLALLYDLERIGPLLRDGNEPFHPDRDRLAFARHLIDIGCQPPSGWSVVTFATHGPSGWLRGMTLAPGTATRWAHRSPWRSSNAIRTPCWRGCASASPCRGSRRSTAGW